MRILQFDTDEGLEEANLDESFLSNHLVGISETILVENSADWARHSARHHLPPGVKSVHLEFFSRNGNGELTILGLDNLEVEGFRGGS